MSPKQSSRSVHNEHEDETRGHILDKTCWCHPMVIVVHPDAEQLLTDAERLAVAHKRYSGNE